MIARVIKTLSLVALPISGIWFLFAPGFEPALAIITAMSTALAAQHASKHPRLDDDEETISSDIEANGLPEPLKTDKYSKTVGTHLKMLREQTLKLSLREMTEFLGIESVSTLERYESGEAEFLLALIKKIEEFFRINPRYVETGEGAIFRRFTLSQESVNTFIREGYTPILACCPSQRENLFCHLVYERKMNGYTQLAIADRPGSFSSSGGGKMNIGYLIDALLDVGKRSSAVRILKVTPEEWEAVTDGCYYSKNPFSGLGSADWECMDVFDEWFGEYSKSRARWHANA